MISMTIGIAGTNHHLTAWPSQFGWVVRMLQIDNIICSPDVTIPNAVAAAAIDFLEACVGQSAGLTSPDDMKRIAAVRHDFAEQVAKAMIPRTEVLQGRDPGHDSPRVLSTAERMHIDRQAAEIDRTAGARY